MPVVTDHDGVAVLVLGDGEQRFTPDWMLEVAGLLDEVAASKRPLVTTAQGKVFSNGLVLEWLQANPTEYQSYLSDVNHLLAKVLTLPVPTVAAIQGHAFAGGAMLALAHDQRLMREDRGWFCLPEVDLGIPFHPGMDALVGATLLPDVALRAMTTGHRFTGDEALAARIVAELHPPDDLLDRALEVASALRGKDTVALGQIKRTRHASVVDLLTGA